MTTLRSLVASRRANRINLRNERALRAAIASAPSVESAHEIATMSARR
jgi:hypothetical protein